MSTTAIYTRQSLDKAGHAYGVTRQREACQKLADAKELAQVQVFEDNDKSATTGKRPAFEAMVSSIEAGEITTVLVFHLDRLTRSVKDLVRVMDAGRAHGLNIACVHGVSIDLGDPTGVAVATILTAIAAMEVGHKGARQKASNVQRAKRGAPHWVVRPFGLDRTGPDVFIVEAEAEVLQETARRLLAGEPIRAIVRDLNARGMTSTAGNPLTSRTLQRSVLNPAVIGQRVYNGEVVNANAWAPILTGELQEQVQAVLSDPSRKSAPDDLTAKHLLSGIMLCGKCGNKTYAGSTTARRDAPQRHIYKCAGGHCLARVREPVDEAVEASIVARLSRPDAAEALPNRSADIRAKRSELTELHKRHKGLVSLLAEGLLPVANVREQAGNLTAEIQALEAEVSGLEMKSPIDSLIAAEDVSSAWENTPMQDKRKIVRTLMDVHLLPATNRQTFSPDDIKIDWK